MPRLVPLRVRRVPPPASVSVGTRTLGVLKGLRMMVVLCSAPPTDTCTVLRTGKE